MNGFYEKWSGKISLGWRIWIFLMALIVAMNCVGNSPMPSIVYEVMVIVSMVVTLFVSVHDRVQLSYSVIAIIIASLLSIIIAQPDSRFRSFQRLAFFSAMLITISPMLMSPKINIQRRILLRYILYFIVLLSVGSFICYFLGINRMQSIDNVYYDDFYSVGGTFGGLVKHSMLLGPLAVISVLFLLNSRAGFLKNKLFRYTLIIASLGALLMAASRGAIYGGIISIIYVLFMQTKNKIKFIKRIVFLIVVILITYPIWSFLLGGIIYKNESRSDADPNNGLFSTRMHLINHRLDEFKNNPLTGVGFSSAMSFYYPEVKKSGTVEYGNSWLAILSTIGIMGAIPCLYLFISRFLICLKQVSVDNDFLLVSSTLGFFFIHFLIEGYVMSPGNPLCFIFWLFLSNAVVRVN